MAVDMQPQVPPQQVQQAPQQVPQQQVPQVDPDMELKELAAIIYGEGASTNADVKAMIGSSVLNRRDAERYSEFGTNIEEIGQKGYYASKDGTGLYQEAKSGKFKDDMSEKAYKESYAIASGLIKGTISRHEAQFYFTPKEITKLKKKGKGAFNFDLVKQKGDMGDYKTFSY